MAATSSPKRQPCAAIWARHLAHGWMDRRTRFAISVCRGTQASYRASTRRISTVKATRTTPQRASKGRSCADSTMSLRNVSFLRIRRRTWRRTVAGLRRGRTSPIEETTWSTWWRLIRITRPRKRMLNTWAALAPSASSMAPTLTNRTPPFPPWSTRGTWKGRPCSTSPTKCKWSRSYSSRAWQPSQSSKTCPRASRSSSPATPKIRACACQSSVTVATGREKSPKICLPRITERLHSWRRKIWGGRWPRLPLPSD